MKQRDRRLDQAEEAYRAQDWARARAIYGDLVAAHPSPPGELLVGLSDSLKYTGAFPRRHRRSSVLTARSSTPATTWAPPGVRPASQVSA
jgi:hypothetical protein